MEILSLYRSVYEGGELDQFKGRLNNHITNHDKEIERMCNYHYQGFIDSIRELLKVSTDAAQLKVWKYIYIYIIKTVLGKQKINLILFPLSLPISII